MMARFNVDDVLVQHEDHIVRWGDAKDKLPAGTYYLIEDTGEILTSENDAMRACEENETRYFEGRVAEWYVCRAEDMYRAHPYVAFGHDADNSPPAMLAANEAKYGNKWDWQDCDTRDEALKVANEWAKLWSTKTTEAILVCDDTATESGDEYALWRRGKEVPRAKWPQFL